MTIHVEASATAASRASRIQTVRSPSGIEAWLLEDHTLPMASIAFAFRGGAALDPDGKEGTARVLGGVLTDGAGEMDGQAFQDALADEAIKLSFNCHRDRLKGGMTTLAQSLPRAFELLGLALARPRIETSDIERRRSSFAAGLRMALSQPSAVADEQFLRRAHAGHPYGRSAAGTLSGLDAIERDDVIALHRAMITRDRLRIAVVGAIGAEALADALEAAFGGLPSRPFQPIAPTAIQGLGEQIVTEMSVPQSTIVFGRPAIAIHDVDHPALIVVNHCFGGGGMTSRLFKEVRETRGLCYAIGTGYDVAEGLASLRGSTSTRNENVAAVIDLIHSELARLAREGIGAPELEAAKSYLIGSNALRFDTSSAIAEILLAMQLDQIDKSWLDRRNPAIAAVTQEDAARVIARVFGDGALLVSIAGRP